MDWVQGLFNLLAAAIGGGIAIIAERYRVRGEVRLRTADTLAELYTQFLVTFHTALRANERYYDGVRLKAERNWDFDESETAAARANDERLFREAVWRLCVRERSGAQKKRLEGIAVVFDHDINEFDMLECVAAEYSARAEKLRKDATAIIDGMQELHATELRARR